MSIEGPNLSMSGIGFPVPRSVATITSSLWATAGFMTLMKQAAVMIAAMTNNAILKLRRVISQSSELNHKPGTRAQRCVQAR